MGYSSAYEMALATDLDSALEWHLTANCYPPLPLKMLPTCRAAIEAVVAGDSDRRIALPDGTTWKDTTTAPAGVIVDAHRLAAFVDAAYAEVDQEEEA